MTVRPLEADTVRVRWLSVTADDDAHLPLWRRMLDDAERQRADRFVFAADRNVFTAAHALTRAMLSEATGRSIDVWRYEEGEHGRPELASSCATDGLRFNISHTRGLVACAIARSDAGVDVEAADRSVDFALADFVFAPKEAATLKAAPPEDRRLLFFRFWTLKEAFIKATGEGLRRPLNSFSFALDPVRIRFHPEHGGATSRDDPQTWRFDEFRPAANRRLALAVRSPLPGTSAPRRSSRAAGRDRRRRGSGLTGGG